MSDITISNFRCNTKFNIVFVYIKLYLSLLQKKVKKIEYTLQGKILVVYDNLTLPHHLSCFYFVYHTFNI